MGKNEGYKNKEQLKQKLERLRVLFNGIDEPIYVSDPDTYEILFVNEKLKALFGEKILGKKCHKVFQNLDHPCPFCTNKHIFGPNIGKTYIWEFQNKRNKRWYRCIDKAIEWPGGKYVRYEMAIDITKHKKAEERLRQLYEFNKEVLERSPAGILRLDEKLRIVYENLKMKEILGVPPGEQSKALGTDIRMWQSMKKVGLSDKFNNLLEGKEIATETPFTSIYGKKSFLNVIGVPILEENKFAGAILLVTDITEYKKNEEKLRESERKYRNLFESARDVIITFDLKGNVTSINKVAMHYGFKKDEIVGKSMLKFVPKKYWSGLLKDLAKVAQGSPIGGEIEIITPKGKKIAEYKSNPIRRGRKVVGFQAILRDITENKRDAEALRKEKEKFKRLFVNNPEAAVYVGPDSYILDVNPRFEELFGYSLDEIKGKHINDVVVPEDKMKEAEMLDKKIMKGYVYHETVRKKKDRSLIPVFISATPIIVEDELIGSVVLYKDISKRKKVEEALRESEELFRSVVENSHDGVLIVDDSFKFVYINDELSRILGYPEEEIIGQDFRKFLDEDSKSLVKDRYLRRQRGEKVPSTYEFKIVRKNGEKRDVEIKSTVINDGHGRIRTVAQILDITERKRFEERLSDLNVYGQSLSMAKTLEEIYKLTLKAMKKTLGFEYAGFLMVEGKVLHLTAQCGYPVPLNIRLPLDGKKGITVKAVKTGKPFYVPNVRKEKAYVGAGVKGMHSEFATPIKIGNEILGVLNIESRRLDAFNENDEKLLKILASYAAIAISNLRKHEELRKISKKLANLLRSSTKIMHTQNMHQRLATIAKAIKNFGWGRVVISLRDQHLEIVDLVTVGLTKEDVKLLWKRKAPGRVWREHLGPKFERFKIGEFYYLPWSDPWVRENVHGVQAGVSSEEATTYTGVPSRLSPKEMVDWHPQDMLYAPLRTPEGKIVGILSIDDPVDGRRPTRQNLTPLELFLHHAAITIENTGLIDDLKVARKQLEVYAGQLERKVEERTRKLNKSHEQLLKAQRLAVIGELAGMVGHDLRNPLTSISGAAYYLKKRLGSKIDGKIKEMLNLIENNIVYSNKIINDLLGYSREIKLDLTESNPKSIVRAALSLVEIPKNVQVIDLTENKPKIKVDVGKMKRAFVNIIKNAIDAMPKGGTLTVKSKKSDGNLKFIFSDTGVGMSKKTMENLWTPLFTTKAKGMGFGLPICKRIIEAHGGSISIKSDRGKGTAFTVTIPTKPKKEGGEKIWVKPLESSLLTTTKT